MEEIWPAIYHWRTLLTPFQTRGRWRQLRLRDEKDIRKTKRSDTLSLPLSSICCWKTISLPLSPICYWKAIVGKSQVMIGEKKKIENISLRFSPSKKENYGKHGEGWWRAGYEDTWEMGTISQSNIQDKTNHFTSTFKPFHNHFTNLQQYSTCLILNFKFISVWIMNF